MRVFGDSSTGSHTHVNPDVKPLRVIHLAQNRDGMVHHLHHLCADLPGEQFDTGNMCKRQHHQVPAGVWVTVEDGINILSAMNYQVVCVIIPLRRQAKNTACGVF